MKVSICLICLIMLANNAWADTILYQQAATGCTPYHDAIHADLYTNANGNVRFKENKTGTIYLVCNVDKSVPYIRNLYLTWYDPTGSDDRNYLVGAQLKRISKSTGNIDNIVGVGSDNYSGSESPITRESTPLYPVHQFDHQKYYYYIIVTLKRTGTSYDIKAYGVSIKG